MASWLHAVVAFLAAVVARRGESPDLVASRSSWRWRAGAAGFGEDLVNKRGGGSDRSRSSSSSCHGGKTRRVSFRSEAPSGRCFGSSGLSLAQGWRMAGGRSGEDGCGQLRRLVPDLGARAPWPFVRSTIQVSAFSSGDSCFLQAWWCSSSRVRWELAFFFSGGAGGGDRLVVRWISFAVVLVSFSRLCMLAYVCCIVRSSL